MQHMDTDFMLADVVTKPLGVATFDILKDRSRRIALQSKEESRQIGGENNVPQATLLGDSSPESHGSVLLD